MPRTIIVVGGGPAGLYFSVLFKKLEPESHVQVFERNRADDTFGWGVVFSDQTLDNFRAADEPTYRAITDNFAHWDDINVVVRGREITSGGHGFSGIARKTLLNILQSRAHEVGVELQFSTEAAALGEADLIVAADGVNSGLRTVGGTGPSLRSGRQDMDVVPSEARDPHLRGSFETTIDVRPNRFIWLGTTLPLDAFTFFFAENEYGVFQAHCYKFDAKMSTFIVECDEKSWRAAHFDEMDTDESIAACEAMFADSLGGHRLVSNATHRNRSPWTQFSLVRNRKWFHGNTVLIGDAAHTAHFSIGSGTKLAMEDAIALARRLAGNPIDGHTLGGYQDERMTEALRLQNAARNSMEWFENVRRYIHLPAEQFAYSLLTRSQRVSHENLRLRDSTYVDGVERWFASRAERARKAGGTGPSLRSGRQDGAGAVVPNDSEGPAPAVAQHAVPPMFTPFRLRGMTLTNRVVLAPMDMYSAIDGTPNDFHLVHLGARALGGAALIMTEMVCVSPEARITLGCTGMYTKEHALHWLRVVKFVHQWSKAKICLQLGHSGRKGATRLPWEGQDVHLAEHAWETVGPSPVTYAPQLPPPRIMTRDDMDGVRDAFVRSVALAEDAGFDMIELHCAHGYLLSSFLTPVSNKRNDAYGGSLENRLRFPLEVFEAMRARWPADRPMSVRISATDWHRDGLTNEESVQIGKAFMDAGADIIHVSTGQTSMEAEPVYGRLYQTPYADRIRNEGELPTIAVGNVTEPDQVNGIIAAGRADLVAIGRPHLSDPHWTLHAAASLGYKGVDWPNQYHLGRVQLEREVAKSRNG